MDSSELLQYIKERAGIPEEEILVRVAQKQQALQGLLSKEGALHIVANEVGITGKEIYSKRISLNKLVAGMKISEVEGKVVRVFSARQYERNGRHGSVGSFVVQDASASMRVVLWDDKTELLTKLHEGDKVTIENPRVQENQGIMEMHVGSSTRLTVSPPSCKPLSAVTEQDAVLRVYGTIVAVHDFRYFEQCPVCRKRMSTQQDKWLCQVHGQQAPDYGYMLSLVLDDGTAAMRTILFSRQVDQLFGVNSTQIKGLRENEAQLAELKKQFLCNEIMITCCIRHNKFFSQPELHATYVTFPTPLQILKHLEQLA